MASVAAAVVEPSLWPWTAGFWAVDHGVAVAAGLRPQCDWLGPNLSRLPGGEGRVALTLDDGPDPRRTPPVLEVLERFEVRATFFVIGERARRWPELTREIAARGHRLENHSWSHPHAFGFYSPWALARQIDRAQETIAELAERAPTYFRAPAGIRSPLLEPLLAPRGLRLASWTRRGFDAVDRDLERVSERLLRGLSGGDILLVHDGRSYSRETDTAGSSSSSGDGASSVDVPAELCQRVLEACRDRGFEVGPLP